MKEGHKDLLSKVDSFLTEKLKGYDELKNVVTHGLPSYLANDISKLKKERDKVLQRLGEQTFQLLQQGRLIVPGIVQSTYRTAQEIVERIVRIETEPECDVEPQESPEVKEPPQKEVGSRNKKKSRVNGAPKRAVTPKSSINRKVKAVSGRKINVSSKPRPKNNKK